MVFKGGCWGPHEQGRECRGVWIVVIQFRRMGGQLMYKWPVGKVISSPDSQCPCTWDTCCSRRRACRRALLCGRCASPWGRRTSGRGWRPHRWPIARRGPQLRAPNQSCSRLGVLSVKSSARPPVLLDISRGSRSPLACAGPGTIQRNLG